MSRHQNHLFVGLAVFFVCTGPVLRGQEGPTPADPSQEASRSRADDPTTGDAAPRDTGKSGPVTEKAAPADPLRPGQAEIRPPQGARPRTKTERPTPMIREPSQGRPIFRMSGETFYFVMRLTPEVNGRVGFALRHAMEPAVRVPLRPTTPPAFVNGEYCSLVLEIPGGTQPGLYDLEVRAGAAVYYSRRSVKVVDAFKTHFRLVHLSNMNIGDLTAPDFDEMLPNEINLLAPEFIITTGNYTEWARARDDASSWTKVLKFFERFNAPVFMLCGLHDHEASFTDIVATTPIDTIDYGGYHGLLLLDHPGNPIDQDYDQLAWIDADLKKNRDKRFNFIVANSDELALLDIWRERGGIEDFVKEHRVKMFIVGGSTDWDFKEFAQKLQGLDDLHLIRTHQASTAMRDRATGFSHYRVIEVNNDQVSYIYPNDVATERLQHSIPTGRLRAYYDAPNDGSVGRVGVTVQNALNQPFDDVRVWLRVAKGHGGTKPTIAPGRVVRILDAGRHWACDVAVNLPDKGAVRVVASINPAQVPGPRPITVELDAPADWSFEPRTTDFGLSYFVCQAPVTLKLTNSTEVPQTCWPVIRVNGSQLHPDRETCPRLPLTIEPGKTASVPLVLNLRRVSPGRHTLQVYFLEDPLSRLHTFDVRLTHQAQAAGDPDRAP
jgi:3',5'-cyclic AMP phosphodiesterase CpdA